jgi:hypothetical protein
MASRHLRLGDVADQRRQRHRYGQHSDRRPATRLRPCCPAASWPTSSGVSAPDVLRGRENLPLPPPAVWSSVRWSPRALTSLLQTARKPRSPSHLAAETLQSAHARGRLRPPRVRDVEGFVPRLRLPGRHRECPASSRIVPGEPGRLQTRTGPEQHGLANSHKPAMQGYRPVVDKGRPRPDRGE